MRLSRVPSAEVYKDVYIVRERAGALAQTATVCIHIVCDKLFSYHSPAGVHAWRACMHVYSVYAVCVSVCIVCRFHHDGVGVDGGGGGGGNAISKTCSTRTAHNVILSLNRCCACARVRLR